ncbi:iron dicitrate transport regulator FecR [Leptospira fletcheri]|uniref:Iron dicitrate transport regulator FecR n=2 Tax=Leptospira fletcheri TaxID=2484981 RepID=A0A4R9GBE0_9LEPT|nr:FecR family protein [Leptospira fletcheri]TGK09088.1 iron dicitrate transport regulator FecR [Leptospira fletcheri]
MAFLLSIGSSAMEAADEVAVVLFVTGEASYSQRGKKGKVSKNLVLGKEDTLDTSNGRVDLQVGSSAVIRVAPFSKIKISELSSTSKDNSSTVELVSGKIFAKVDKSPRKENFTVTSASYTAGVRGTQFVISEEPKGSNPQAHEHSDIPDGIFVKEGEVGVSSSAGRDFSLNADEQAVQSQEGLLKQPLAEFMKEKMRVMDQFKKLSDENYQLLKEQKLKNQQLLESTKSGIK